MKITFWIGALLAAVVAQEKVIFSVKWDLDKPVPSEKLSGPITKYGTSHPKVTHSVCGAARSDRLIPATDTWSNSGPGGSCNSMVGASAFYAFNWPNGASANTGNEENDVLFTYFVKDMNSQTYLVVALDKARNPDAGALTLTMDSPKLKGVSATSVLCDDGSECKPGFDKSTGKGSFYWGWGGCCGDGMVFGPLPAKDYCFNFKASSYRGLSSFGFGGWDEVGDKFDKITFPMTTFNKGVSVCALAETDFCGQMSTCGECADQGGKCGWCHDSGKVGCKPSSFASQCSAFTGSGQCCQSCASVTNANTCLSSTGCAWCYQTGKCISHNKGVTCSTCSDKQVSEPNVSPKYCAGAVDASGNTVDPLTQPVTKYCSNKGTCDSQFKCQCQTGYFGVGCEKVCGACDGGGSCGRDDGLCICDVNKGGSGCTALGCSASGAYCQSGNPCTKCGIIKGDGKSCTGVFDTGICKCQKGYWGNLCDGACPGIVKSDGSGVICGGFGDCQNDGTCKCAPCYQHNSAGICVPQADPNCGSGVVVCNSVTGNKECKCPGNLGGAGCTTCQCKNGMACNSITGLCECGTAYIGDLCDKACTRAGACNGNGECNAQTSSCKCDPAWLGKFCDQPAYTCTPPGSGQYVTTVCDPVNQVDTKFATCSTVSAGNYIAAACQAGSTTKVGSDTDIKPCLTCSSGLYRTGCGGSNAGTCVDCPACVAGKYRLGCANNNVGTCQSCTSCGAGQYKLNCGVVKPYNFAGSCTSCAACPNAQYRSGCGSTYDAVGQCVACSSCPSNQYRSGCMGVMAGQCTNCATCPAGQYNKGCGAASTGYIVAGTCTNCATCPGGQYLSGCTGIAAGTCQACQTNCPSGQYRSNCSGRQAGSCTSCQTCPSGQYNAGCTGLSAGACNTCGSCPSGQYRSGCTGIAGGSCQACAACPAGQYRSGCTGTNPGSCVSCASNCPSGQYRNGCSGMSPGSCSVCPTCANGQYNNGCTGLSPGSCTNCQTCSVGSALVGCSGQSAGTCTTCQSCPSGQYRINCAGANPGTCSNCASCPSGQYLNGCSGLSAGSCTVCPTCVAGSYLNGCGGLASGSCTQCSACPSGQYKSGCSGSNAGTCQACVQCNANQYLTKQCSGTVNAACQNCDPCPVGQERINCGPTSTSSGTCQATKSPTLAPTRTPKPTALPTSKPTQKIVSSPASAVTSIGCGMIIPLLSPLTTADQVVQMEKSYKNAVVAATGVLFTDVVNVLCIKQTKPTEYKCSGVVKSQTATPVVVVSTSVAAKLAEDVNLLTLNNGKAYQASDFKACADPTPAPEKALGGSAALAAAAADLSNVSERPSLYMFLIAVAMLILMLPAAHNRDKKLAYEENYTPETHGFRMFLSRHLWTSIWFRDPASRFSSKERLLVLVFSGLCAVASAHVGFGTNFMVQCWWLGFIFCLPRVLFEVVFSNSAKAKSKEPDQDLLADAFAFEKPAFKAVTRAPRTIKDPAPPPPPPPGGPPPQAAQLLSAVPPPSAAPPSIPSKDLAAPQVPDREVQAAAAPSSFVIPDKDFSSVVPGSSVSTNQAANRPFASTAPAKAAAGRHAWNKDDDKEEAPAKCSHGVRLASWVALFVLIGGLGAWTLVYGLASGDIVSRVLLMLVLFVVVWEPLIFFGGKALGFHRFRTLGQIVQKGPPPRGSVSSVFEEDTLPSSPGELARQLSPVSPPDTTENV